MSKIPASVLAFEKKLVPSDGLMYGTTWEKRTSISQPLKLQEKSVRGTISNRLKKSDEGKVDAKIESANLQTVDSCALTPEQDTLKLSFTLKVLSGVETPSACNHEGFNQTYTDAVSDYIETNGFIELANRYATNLANARFLWRNRVGCEDLEVNIKVLGKDSDKSWDFKSHEISTQDFNNPSSKITELGGLIAQTLSGENEFLLLEINAYAKVGKSQDVYPSEELVLDKNNSKEKKSKILYHVDEIAAMHSQKIGNAIRSIDTWYPKFEQHQKPIAIDPYGAVTNLGRAYRQPKDKTDFFSLFDKFSQSEKLDNVEDEHFVMAVLVRGGVFGEKQ
ncbi:MAG: type I-F CRISPR-associated protein Csy3 [gamma proteobacterium symbiont of Taylorina sp.]|nr:type I-F CRISPR-associated protein Csy3 [gamma proteobacterium symbiont of Taylorina sp.]